MHQAAFMPRTETVEDFAMEKVTTFGAFFPYVPSPKSVSVGDVATAHP